MRNIRQPTRRVTIHTVAVGALVLSACTVSACAASTGFPAGAATARIFINGERLPTTYPVSCTQRSWLWTIETEPQAPGFTAIIETGGTIEPRIMRLTDMNGFTGSSARVATPADASVEGTTFHLSGTARGSFADHPTSPAEVQYRMEAHC